jgi:hypothetical protein
MNIIPEVSNIVIVESNKGKKYRLYEDWDGNIEFSKWDEEKGGFTIKFKEETK